MARRRGAAMVGRRLGLLVLLMPLAQLAVANVTAQVDRNAVEQNESFLFEVVVDGNTSSEPDVSALNEDFIVGQSSQLSNTKIINGQISRSMTWTYTLMARRAGQLTIPSIRVGSYASDPIVMIVSEPQQAPPGEADVFVTAEVDSESTWVQAQVLYRIKVYRAVATRQPTLRRPVVSGAEALVEMASDEKTYDALLNGRAYNVVEQSMAIFPQESGEIQISPARFEARVLANGRITGRKVFESEAKTITVRPIPAPPAEYSSAAWLPARDLELTESWSREPDRLTVGEPISRNIRVSALGQLETQIPVLDLDEPDGINLYPDQPELSRSFEAGGIRGVRRDQYAMIAVGNGDVTLPAVTLPWFDTDTQQWQVASLPERTLSILGTATDAAEPTDAAPEPIVVTAPSSGGTSAVSSPFWQQIALGLAVLWVLTILVWWWSSRPKAAPREPLPMPVYKLQAKNLKAARKAALDGDAAALRTALLEWGRLEWPDAAPRSLGSLAERLEAPLADQLKALSRSSYGPDAPHWDGQAIARSLRSFAVSKPAGRAETSEALPPLMPGR
ncbi:MAG: BatD family protein [Pseudomonadota bacterium]